MTKNPTTSIIAIIVVAVVIICIYVLNTGKTTPNADPVVETATPQVVSDTTIPATAVETVVTPVTATPAE